MSQEIYKVDGVCGHPDTSKISWAAIDRQLTSYLRKRGLMEPYKPRGFALRAHLKKEREISIANQGKNKNKKEKNA